MIKFQTKLIVIDRDALDDIPFFYDFMVNYNISQGSIIGQIGSKLQGKYKFLLNTFNESKLFNLDSDTGLLTAGRNIENDFEQVKTNLFFLFLFFLIF